jgi:hypothetical protein
MHAPMMARAISAWKTVVREKRGLGFIDQEDDEREVHIGISEPPSVGRMGPQPEDALPPVYFQNTTGL